MDQATKTRYLWLAWVPLLVAGLWALSGRCKGAKNPDCSDQKAAFEQFLDGFL